MKRIISYLLISLLILCSVIFVSSCDFMKSEDEILDEKVQNFIDLLDENDKESLKSLFAPAKIGCISNFDDSLDELFEYYDGVFKSKSHESKGTDGDKNGDFTAKWYNLSYIITTSSEQYRLAIYWCTEYSTDSNYLGIWSLYIIKENEYPTPVYTYRGDGLWTPGINIGKVYVEDK